MKKIAFSNFRRFQDFPLLELGKISIIVGRNNSGKSTMVKAFLLFLDYLQNQQYNEFSFSNKSLEDANIVTFGRAKNNQSEENKIIFKFHLDEFLFVIQISGSQDDTSVRVDSLLIFDDKNNIELLIDYQAKDVKIKKSELINNKEAYVNNGLILVDLYEERDDLENITNKSYFIKSSAEGLRIIDQLNKIKKQIENLEKEMNSNNDNIIYYNELFEKSYDLKSDIFSDMTENNVIQEIVSDYFYQNNIALKKSIEYRHKNYNELLDIKGINNNDFEEIIENNRHHVLKSIDKALNTIQKTKIYYLGANPSKQSALFSLRDKQNNLAQAIHDFKQSKILDGESEYEFVQYWMEQFEVGVNFEIKFYAGEAYEFYVIDKEGLKAHLADKGMGSLQAMMIILSVATLLRKHKNNLNYITVIVEEPELNLHPALQGELAMFFHDVNKEYGIEFIIETHSEYLIRKSQNILVKEEYTNDGGLNPHPFKLYYFDVENGPYEMKYQENGKFDRKFGKGFFDYSDELEVETYKLNLKKNK